MTRGVDSGENTFHTTSGNHCKSHGTAKRGEKRHWQYIVPLERGKLHGDRLRLNRQRRRLYN